jgi:predicted Rossmann fold flavoprotein
MQFCFMKHGDKNGNAYSLICIGGGAASFYAAAQLKALRQDMRILIIEKGKDVLQKVRISGGGRCNVTNQENDPDALSAHYPRGSRQLKAAFHRHGPVETKAWFTKCGVRLKTESDGRVFPVSDTSLDIIHCLEQHTLQKGVSLHLQESFSGATMDNEGQWHVVTSKQTYTSRALFLGTGSNSLIWKWLHDSMKIKITDPVPSLFTFHIRHPLLEELMGLTLPHCKISIPGTKLATEGPVLITHWGLSGPAILRLSAWAARHFYDKKYKETILLDLSPERNHEEVKALLTSFKHANAKKKMPTLSPLNVPLRFWKSLLKTLQIQEETTWANLSKQQMAQLVQAIKHTPLDVTGKSTFKEEFVTAGGVDLSEVNFKYFNLKAYPTLYMAGEVLDIDGITGGFNFQAAWTGAWIAASHMAETLP